LYFLNGLHGVNVMPDASKIHPILADRMRLEGLVPTAPIPIVILFRQDQVGISDAVEGVDPARRAFRLIPATSNVATRDGIERLTDQSEVKMVWYDAPVHSMADVSLSLIGVPPVWQLGISGKGIKVGIVDTGIDPNHPDFSMRIAQVKDLTGEGPLDNNGHGTHIAGIIGGSGAASGGALKGVAWECLLYVAKALRGDGSGSTSDAMAGIEWAVQQGVQVLNVSPGSDEPSDGTDALAVMCDAAVNKGVVVCAAAGNSGPAQGTMGSPACAREVITVGATDKENQMASFSSRGPTLDGRGKPDLCLPGVNVISCRASRTSMGTPLDESYTRASGTCLAAAHAAGISALLLQARPGLSPRQIKEVLMKTAKTLSFDVNAQGMGLADVFAAYSSAVGEVPQAQKPTPTPPPPGCLGTLKTVLGGR
jgi:serine protease AprX